MLMLTLFFTTAMFDFKGTWNDFFAHVKADKIYNGDPVCICISFLLVVGHIKSHIKLTL